MDHFDKASTSDFECICLHEVSESEEIQKWQKNKPLRVLSLTKHDRIVWMLSGELWSLSSTESYRFEISPCDILIALVLFIVYKRADAI